MAAPQAQPFAMTPPNIGGVAGANLTPWTGGIPNASWSASDTTNPLTPYCYHFPDDKSLKVYAFQTNAPDDKFKRDDADYPLSSFAEDLMDKFARGGMAYLFHMLDPIDRNTRVNILEFHSRFTKDNVADEVQFMTADPLTRPGTGTRFAVVRNRYDAFDKANLNAARVYLLSALDEGLKVAIRPQITADMSVMEIWMIIVAEVQSDSIRAHRKLERDIEKMKLDEYAGENVKELARDLLVKCSELERAKRLPSDMILTIVEIFSKCSVEDFRIHFIGRRSDVEKFLKESAGKSAAVVALMPTRITYRILIDEAISKYQSLVDSTDGWGPAAKLEDKGGAPSAFASCMSADDMKKMFEAQLSLMAKQGQFGGTRTCYNCGADDHFAKDCPKPPKSNGNGGRSKGWKKIAPIVFKDLVKTAEGQKWTFCAHCNRYTPSHDTATHSGAKKNGVNNADWDPTGKSDTTTILGSGSAAQNNNNNNNSNDNGGTGGTENEGANAAVAETSGMNLGNFSAFY